MPGLGTACIWSLARPVRPFAVRAPMSGLYLGRLSRWAIARPMMPVAIMAHVRLACRTFCNLGHHTRLQLGQSIG